MVGAMRLRTLLGGARGAALLISAPAAQAASPVSARAVSFSVQNVNRSKQACDVDGKRYTVRGHLVGRRADLRDPQAVTLYLHGLGFGEFFWRSKAAPGYDFSAGMARRGHLSVVIDRIGYRTSGTPAGADSCMGSQADVAHQIVQQLRSGSYRGGGSPSFAKVALAGHSAGGLIAQMATYSFGDVDALAVIAYADQGKSKVQLDAGLTSTAICVEGGQRVDGRTGQRGYALLGQTKAAAKAGFFATTPARVFAKTFPLITRNPCGDLSSYVAAPRTNVPNLPSIKVPVLVVQASRDALFPVPSGRRQAALFTGSSAVTYRSLPATAHSVTTERGRGKLQRELDAWLDRSGL